MIYGRKLIKRKPKGGAKPSEFYFNAGTQQAIIDYKAESCPTRRNEIYLRGILPAFNKLVENLINVYGFQIQYESKADLLNECSGFLYGVITKFDSTKGTKAFSYFNVVAKNWLIIRSKQSARNTHSFTSLDDRDSLSQHDLELIESFYVSPSPEEAMINDLDGTYLRTILDSIANKTTTENEDECLKGINVLFENVNELDFLNKRAVMLYLREIVGAGGGGISPKALSVVLSSMKKLYKAAKDEMEVSQ